MEKSCHPDSVNGIYAHYLLFLFELVYIVRVRHKKILSCLFETNLIKKIQSIMRKFWFPLL